ncbi:hypothetical protein [Pseudobacteriovorax antillogorgiicola]|uniref:Uncharacterized protein n=1 Tax=Pseudobacteriovorax antillogorgiicola TaxID=1513793 RepID=A0A1Y6C3D8_9BACT|nr:hypothetical protein [Pseudobacteriovorax antillogorgiicola]TCS43373.1 hypothetical protein EDD56_13713 [Pseudobacteriovorax antillogorgiicola]SMF35031.1 hypothetical protein SAMN06296036_110195 [Pseudobacteriovorax antillogorgiicola]
MSQLIEIDFANPKPIDLDDDINLKDVFNALVAKGAVSDSVRYFHWSNKKLEYYTENIDYFTRVLKNTRKYSRGAHPENHRH